VKFFSSYSFHFFKSGNCALNEGHRGVLDMERCLTIRSGLNVLGCFLFLMRTGQQCFNDRSNGRNNDPASKISYPLGCCFAKTGSKLERRTTVEMAVQGNDPCSAVLAQLPVSWN